MKDALSKADAYAKDTKKTTALLQEAVSKFQRHQGFFASVAREFGALIRVLRAWKSGEYPSLPKRSLLYILGAIIYFVMPFDLIADFIPGIGMVDDAFVVSYVMNAIRMDIDAFRKWEEERGAQQQEEPAA